MNEKVQNSHALEELLTQTSLQNEPENIEKNNKQKRKENDRDTCKANLNRWCFMINYLDLIRSTVMTYFCHHYPDFLFYEQFG